MLHPRARTMLLLSLPAVAIGIASSLILIVVMKIASVLQNLLWQRLPGTLGIAQDSPLWIIGVLTLTGIAVGLVIRFSQGHAGPDPACEPLIGAPVPPSALPGLIVALILGLAGGVSLGPEHPIMTVNIALAVAIGARLLPRVNRMEWTILASAGTIGALFGTPVAAALIFSQTLNGSSEVPLWDRLFAPLMAAAAGALTTGLFFHPHFSLPIAHYGQMEMTDILSGAIVAAIAIAAGTVAVWCLPRLHAMMHQMKNPVLVLGIGGFIVILMGLDPTRILVMSQVLLSFGIALALVPLLIFTSDSKLMGDLVNSKRVKQTGWVIVVLVVALNIWLLVGTALGL
ncbi:ion channel protein [Escherichia coli]|nr:ion channel protein [Escherichia coli]